MHVSRWAFLALFSMLILPKPAAAAPAPCDTLSLEATAALTNDPGFEGQYKYTLSGQWDVGRRPLNHMDVLLSIGGCSCACDPAIVQFAEVAGASSGYEPGQFELCRVTFTGEYLCGGNPNLGGVFAGPTITLSPRADPGCESGILGQGTWIFYTSLPPASPRTYRGAVALNAETETCTGTIVGQMPMCQCITPLQPGSWGLLKAAYR